MINPVTARFIPVTGRNWRPAWWRVPLTALRVGLRLALRDGVQHSCGRIQLAARPARMDFREALAFAHAQGAMRPAPLQGRRAAGTSASSSHAVVQPDEAAIAVSREERFDAPRSAATLPHEPPRAHRVQNDASAWPPVSPVWATASSRQAGTRLNAMQAQPVGNGIFDVDDQAVSRHGPHAIAGAPRGRSLSSPMSRHMSPAAPASDPALLPMSAVLAPRPAKRPVPRGEAQAAPNSPPASLGDALFDQAMQHRALPRFELHALPAAPVATTAASAQQALASTPATSVAGSHSPIEAPALSRAELVRVADQVERLLMQRERFERERRGGL